MPITVELDSVQAQDQQAVVCLAKSSQLVPEMDSLLENEEAE